VARAADVHRRCRGAVHGAWGPVAGCVVRRLWRWPRRLRCARACGMRGRGHVRGNGSRGLPPFLYSSGTCPQLRVAIYHAAHVHQLCATALHSLTPLLHRRPRCAAVSDGTAHEAVARHVPLRPTPPRGHLPVQRSHGRRARATRPRHRLAAAAPGAAHGAQARSKQWPPHKHSKHNNTPRPTSPARARSAPRPRPAPPSRLNGPSGSALTRALPRQADATRLHSPSGCRSGSVSAAPPTRSASVAGEHGFEDLVVTRGHAQPPVLAEGGNAGGGRRQVPTAAEQRWKAEALSGTHA
jgi:hypothetical protein